MKSEKIMIVDDNKEFLEELQEMLSLSGYDTVAINDSSKVLITARRLKPGLILLDLRMPGVNGFDVAGKLKQFPETASIPIIAMSGYFPLEKDSLLLDVGGMQARLKKPFSISDIITQIEHILGKNEGNN